MEPSHDHIEKTLDKLVASTRSPRGRYSASESWKLLERRLVPPRTKRLRLFRLAGHIGNYFARPDEGDAEPLFLFDLPGSFQGG